MGVYVTRIGSDAAAVEYRLGGGHGCVKQESGASATPVGGDGVAADSGVSGDGVAAQVAYRADARERDLRWIGNGCAEFGLEKGAALSAADFDKARALMAGADPGTGEQLIKPKVAVFEDAKVSLQPLVDAVVTRAGQAGCDPLDLLASEWARVAWLRAERGVKKSGGSAWLRADEAGRLAEDAGLQPGDVWGSHAFEKALAKLTKTVVTTGPDGQSQTTVIDRRRVVGNFGYDLTFTLPKSYSVLMAFVDESTARKVEDQLEAKILDTFGWIEENTCYGMRGKHGGGKTASKVRGSGFVGWSMVHRAARPVGGAVAGDPHWHMHLSIANMTKGEDGQWSTVAAGGRDLMRHAAAADHAMQALARDALSREFGVRFAMNERTGVWEVEHIPDALLRAFSKRGSSIKSLLSDLGFDDETVTRRAREYAASRTREAKSEEGTSASDETLRDYWQSEARSLNYDPAEIARDALREEYRRQWQINVDDPVIVELVAAAVADPAKGLTAHMRRFTTVDAIGAVAHVVGDGLADFAQLERLTEHVLARPEFVALSTTTGVAVGGQNAQLGAGHMANADRFTTADVLAAEQHILGAAASSSEAQDGPRVPADVAAAAISVVEVGAGHSLADEQVAAINRFVQSGRMVDAVVGAPGSGKTTLMRAAAAAWEAAGYTVGGCATQATTAHNLNHESGISSRTIAQILWSARESARARISAEAGYRDATEVADPLAPTESELAALREAPLLPEDDRAQIDDLARYGGLAQLDVLVIDEASMTDDRAMVALVKEAERTRTKVVMIGDPKQLRGVGCGSVFSHVHRLCEGQTLQVNRRQRDADERAAVQLWRDGKYRAALDSYAQRDRLVTTETGDEAVAAMVADWLRWRTGAPDALTEMSGLIMLADTNESVNRLNDAAQAVRVAQGEIEVPHTFSVRRGDDVAVAAGDHVIVRLNDRSERLHVGPDILNGYRAVVDSVDPAAGVAVRWRDGDDEHQAVLSTEFINNGGLSLGYAMTVHRSQGLTVRGSWQTADGEPGGGMVLKYGAGDAASGHVAASRHVNYFRQYAAREQVETSYDAIQMGVPANDEQRRERVIRAIARQAYATAENANDRPAAADLGLTPEDLRRRYEDEIKNRNVPPGKRSPDARQDRDRARRQMTADQKNPRRQDDDAVRME